MNQRLGQSFFLQLKDDRISCIRNKVLTFTGIIEGGTEPLVSVVALFRHLHDKIFPVGVAQGKKAGLVACRVLFGRAFWRKVCPHEMNTGGCNRVCILINHFAVKLDWCSPLVIPFFDFGLYLVDSALNYRSAILDRGIGNGGRGWYRCRGNGPPHRTLCRQCRLVCLDCG
ncbi:hypothetical protein SBV1_340009 [Verrucomicrobia bacterium]|nr:hypothetical protein SBV1_340009 [Verrucomicrobiota bacterium]